MEAVRTYETSVYSNETTQRCNPEGSNLYTRRRENLKSLYVFLNYEAETFRLTKFVNIKSHARSPNYSIVCCSLLITANKHRQLRSAVLTAVKMAMLATNEIHAM
jgi:uncharacterized protein YlbG (UPF0298 family)